MTVEDQQAEAQATTGATPPAGGMAPAGTAPATPPAATPPAGGAATEGTTTQQN
jgi:hypothetical protein